ncbi:thioredoxin domain-containing protein [Sphingomonas sp. MAH-20]|uniref:Thioredoxin domain-containing protein n=1 Tax=Sphingomonas horti TaxID=2682842 RepID=A0A6I4J8Z7_9SPHN|nr:MULTISPECIES: DsbA family protein [Sphingomonas]MBA2919268.1 DsbA family protein [Sphingomonas sp. CGMCC 1.13658]MVO79301.1 thioredoxin domain-containing protein [Sphingomonas horti]
MTRWLPYAGVALLSGVVASLGTAAALQGRGGEGVRAYLLQNPEVLQEAMDRLRLKQVAAQIAPYRKAIETPYAGAWIGAKDGDVTLVQFFDYACGYCKASLPDVQRLVRDDPKVKVVFRELPILSRESEVAARASLGAAEQGRFAAFHDALYAAGRPSPDTIAAAARAAGLDQAKLAAAMNAPRAEQELGQNIELARTLGFTGTPSWVVGNQVLSGAVGYDALKQAVAEARERS